MDMAFEQLAATNRRPNGYGGQAKTDIRLKVFAASAAAGLAQDYLFGASKCLS